jgi:hypothetical protein
MLVPVRVWLAESLKGEAIATDARTMRGANGRGEAERKGWSRRR